APDGAALLDRLADAVASARYWQAPDEEDPQPADPGAVARLRSIADARRRRHGGGGPPRSTRARRRTCGGWARTARRPRGAGERMPVVDARAGAARHDDVPRGPASARRNCCSWRTTS